MIIIIIIMIIIYLSRHLLGGFILQVPYPVLVDRRFQKHATFGPEANLRGGVGRKGGREGERKERW
jgi:hypothetical protein